MNKIHEINPTLERIFRTNLLGSYSIYYPIYSEYSNKYISQRVEYNSLPDFAAFGFLDCDISITTPGQYSIEVYNADTSVEQINDSSATPLIQLVPTQTNTLSNFEFKYYFSDVYNKRFPPEITDYVSAVISKDIFRNMDIRIAYTKSVNWNVACNFGYLKNTWAVYSEYPPRTVLNNPFVLLATDIRYKDASYLQFEENVNLYDNYIHSYEIRLTVDFIYPIEFENMLNSYNTYNSACNKIDTQIQAVLNNMYAPEGNVKDIWGFYGFSIPKLREISPFAYVPTLSGLSKTLTFELFDYYNI